MPSIHTNRANLFCALGVSQISLGSVAVDGSLVGC
jgi:hypothetical protein